jgi:hypothetical protein
MDAVSAHLLRFASVPMRHFGFDTSVTPSGRRRLPSSSRRRTGSSRSFSGCFRRAPMLHLNWPRSTRSAHRCRMTAKPPTIPA